GSGCSVWACTRTSAGLFFFSSRRRHTRFSRDWSSDVCSSDLGVGNTKVDVSTQNLTFLFGYQPTENWNIYAGPVYQTVKGNLSLRGQAYSIFNGYDATMKETGDLGWLAGLAYQIPEIALKASLTYRSEIDHEADTTERLSAAAGLALIGVNPADIVGTQGTTKI